jgi:hypothetical protein
VAGEYGEAMAVGGVNAVWIESIHVVGQSIGVEEEEEEEEEGGFVFGFLIPSHCCIHGASGSAIWFIFLSLSSLSIRLGSLIYIHRDRAMIDHS